MKRKIIECENQKDNAKENQHKNNKLIKQLNNK